MWTLVGVANYRHFLACYFVFRYHSYWLRGSLVFTTYYPISSTWVGNPFMSLPLKAQHLSLKQDVTRASCTTHRIHKNLETSLLDSLLFTVTLMVRLTIIQEKVSLRAKSCIQRLMKGLRWISSCHPLMREVCWLVKMRCMVNSYLIPGEAHYCIGDNVYTVEDTWI